MVLSGCRKLNRFYRWIWAGTDGNGRTRWDVSEIELKKRLLGQTSRIEGVWAVV